MSDKPDEVNQPSPDDEGDSKNAVKRLIYIVHLDTETNQVIKVEEWDEAANASRDLTIFSLASEEEEKSTDEAEVGAGKEFEFDWPSGAVQADIMLDPSGSPIETPGEESARNVAASFVMVQEGDASGTPNLTIAFVTPKVTAAFARPEGAEGSAAANLTAAKITPKVTAAFITPKVTAAFEKSEGAEGSTAANLTAARITPKVTAAFITPKVTAIFPTAAEANAADTSNLTVAFITPKVTAAFITPKVTAAAPAETKSDSNAANVKNAARPCLTVRFKN
jgi:hypothetical protein